MTGRLLPMTGDGFRAWRDRMELSQDQAAAILRMSSSTVKFIERHGQQPPSTMRVIDLACAALESGIVGYDENGSILRRSARDLLPPETSHA